jgi:hypothetical protein
MVWSYTLFIGRRMKLLLAATVARVVANPRKRRHIAGSEVAPRCKDIGMAKGRHGFSEPQT